MINFEIRYHNVDLKKIEKNLLENKKKVSKINHIYITLPSLGIAQQLNDLDEIKNVADLFIKKKENIVVFGTGGSNLGARALINILYSNEKKQIHFLDNIDPIQFQNFIDKFDLEKTGFIIISKSGFTPETLSQFSSIIEILNTYNNKKNLLKDCVVITENKESALKKIANHFSCKTLNHDKNIGGRYSVFSNVGLLPACIAGVNISNIRAGADEIITKVKNGFFRDHLIGAQLITQLQSLQGINLNVLITYTDALYYFGKWYLQLFAESIGKKSKGITPIHSIGTTDQHSQLQLYLDGPKDKFFTLITKDHRGIGLKMNKKILEDKKIEYLAGKHMGDLMYAEQKATLDTFISNGFPIREIFCDRIDEITIGQLMAYFMMETIAICYLIDVNPFDQPAVELGKKLTKNYLSKDMFK